MAGDDWTCHKISFYRIPHGRNEMRQSHERSNNASQYALQDARYLLYFDVSMLIMWCSGKVRGIDVIII